MQTYLTQDIDTKHPIPRPMVGLGLAFMGGIVYGNTFPVNIVLVMFAVLIVVLGWMAAFRRGSIAPRSPIHWRLAIIVTALLGAVRMEMLHLSWHKQANTIEMLSLLDEQTVSGTVEEIRVYGDGSATVFISGVQIEKENRSRTVSSWFEIRGSATKLAAFEPGDRLETTGLIEPIRGPKVPTRFNGQDYRYSQNIFGCVYIENDTPVSRSPSARWSRVRGFAYNAVDRIRAALPDETQLPWTHVTAGCDEIAGLIASMGFGIRSILPMELSQSLQTSGLAHVTSISGLHVSLILFGIAMLLKRVGLTRKQAAIITAGLACWYVLMVGAQIPALRAVLMAFVFLGSYFIQRRADSLNSLAIAALILLLLHPGELFLASFQLSFAAVLVLILTAPLNVRIMKLKYYPRFLKWLLQGIVTSTAVVIGLAPFTVAYFGLWSWGAILGNLIVIPLVGVLLPVSYMWLMAMLLPFPPLTDVLGRSSEWLCCASIAVIRFFSGHVFYTIVPFPGVAVCVLSFLAFVLMCRPGVKLWGDGVVSIRSYHVALILIAIVMWHKTLFAPWIPLRIDFLSLGQGDCTVIQTPSGNVMLIDGGAPPHPKSQREPLLLDYLNAQGISTIDAMLVTHPEADHIGALGEVARKIPAGTIIEGTRQADSDYYKQFISTITTQGVSRQSVRAGDRIDLDTDVTLWVLSPDGATLASDSSPNEKSVVLLLQYKELDVLLTGDIGFEIEKQLCDRYDNWDVDTLKVPHHGSRFSSGERFLNETRPEFAVIQVGRNTYGHPHREAQARLSQAGAEVLRTDRDGTVRLTSDGQGYRIYTTRSDRLYTFAGQ